MDDANRRWAPRPVLRRAGASVIETIYPRRCAGCGRRGRWVCPDCDAALSRFAPPWCARCGVPSDRWSCRCGELSPDVGSVRSVASYDGWLRRAIIAFKYEDEWARADHLADLLRGAVESLGSADGLVPVPLHPARLRQRGYNQSALLAERVGASLGLPTIPGLGRVRATTTQVGLGGVERQANVVGAFAADLPRVVGLRLVLVDDVVTTGSTIGACAAALTEAGAREILVATLARET